MPSAGSASNPFLSPTADIRTTSKIPAAHPTHGLGIASTVIITCGVIYLVVAITAIPISILMYRAVTADSEAYPQAAFYVDSALKALIYELAFAVIGGLLVYSGWSIRHRKNYWVTVIGSVLGCLPLVILSFFPSAWTLWKLTRPHFRSQFLGSSLLPDEG